MISSIRTAVFAAAILGIGLAVSSVASAAPSADSYASAEISNAVISPDGTHMAVIMPRLGKTGGVAIYKIGAGGSPAVFAPNDVKVRSISWANNNRVLVRVGFTTFWGGEKRRLFENQKWPYEFNKIISIDINAKNPVLMMNDLFETDYSLGNGNVFRKLPNDPEHILMTQFFLTMYSATVNVFKVSTTTGKSQRIETGRTGYTYGWVADTQGNVRVRRDGNSDNGATFFARVAGSTEWKQVYQYTWADHKKRQLDFVGFGDDPNIAYVVGPNGGNTNGLYEFDLRTATVGRAILTNDKADVDAIGEYWTGKIVGGSYTWDRDYNVYFDRPYAQLAADLTASFPNARIEVRSATPDQKKLTVYVEGAEDPAGAFFLVDLTVPAITKISDQYPGLHAADVSPTKLISYKARDGLTIPAYLTVPNGSSAKNMPLIVMPHGGPQARDDAQFDFWAQFMASRGYLVLKPQYRGSAGFGLSFMEAGHFKWGLAMQDDVTDGVKYLVDQGIADPKKVCIVGWSYGGYSALAGAALTPDVYKCSFAGAGVSDLPIMLGYEMRHFGDTLDELGYWNQIIGDVTRDGERLRNTSPARHADRITADLMMMHGKDDIAVPFEQSQIMAKAMDKAGKPYRFIEVGSEDHWLSSHQMRLRLLTEIDPFLAKHLK